MHIAALAVTSKRVGDDRRFDIDSGHVPGDIGEQRRAVAFAACGIEHATARDQPPREGIAMAMLVRDLTDDAGKIALAGELIGCAQESWSREREHRPAACRQDVAREAILPNAGEAAFAGGSTGEAIPFGEEMTSGRIY